MAAKNSTIIAAVVLILVVIILLIAYSYYPSCENVMATPVIDAKAAQTAASKKGKEREETFNSPPREVDNVWVTWKAKHDAAMKLQSDAADGAK